MSEAEKLHTAVCQAVAILNVCPEGAQIPEVRNAHNILRAALADYFMDQPTTAQEQEAIAKLHRCTKEPKP